jgi:hypothetical protein
MTGSDPTPSDFKIPWFKLAKSMFAILSRLDNEGRVSKNGGKNGEIPNISTVNERISLFKNFLSLSPVPSPTPGKMNQETLGNALGAPDSIPNVPLEQVFPTMFQIPGIIDELISNEEIMTQIVQSMMEVLFPKRKKMHDQLEGIKNQITDPLIKKALNIYQREFPKAEMVDKGKLKNIIKEMNEHSSNLTSIDAMLDTSSYESLGLAGHRTTFRDLMISIHAKRDLLLRMDDKGIQEVMDNLVRRSFAPMVEDYLKLILATVLNIKAIAVNDAPYPFTKTLGYYARHLKARGKAWDLIDIRNALHEPVKVAIDRSSKEVFIVLYLSRRDKNEIVYQDEEVSFELDELKEIITGFCSCAFYFNFDVNLFLNEVESPGLPNDKVVDEVKARLGSVFSDKAKLQGFCQAVGAIFQIMMKDSVSQTEAFVSKVLMAGVVGLMGGDKSIKERMIDEALAITGIEFEWVVTTAASFILGPIIDHDIAARLMNFAVSRDGADPLPRFGLAYLLAEEGKKDEAIANLAIVISKDPTYKKHAKNEKVFDSMREDPRFKKLVEGDALPALPQKESS